MTHRKTYRGTLFDLSLGTQGHYSICPYVPRM
nr:MAG TPA: hypothetical protein [Caudoviricetes sp.]